MIRPAVFGDIPALLEMGRRFAERAEVAKHVGFDPHSVVQTLEMLIEGGHPVFIGERGAIGASQTPHPFNHEHIIAQELFWWCEGGGGLALLNRLIEHCAEHCHSLTMITLEAVDPDRVAKIYTRKGFVPLERSFVKVF